MSPRRSTHRLRSRCVLCLIFILIASATAGAQEAGSRPADFEANRIRARVDTAGWLLEYDRAAWIASDSMVAVAEEYKDRLGLEWFCYEEDQQWHVVFGKYDPDADEYVIALHFEEDSIAGFRRLDGSEDVPSLLPYARSLYHSRSRLPATVARRIGAVNWYVRQLPDNRLEVRYLPAQLPNGMILHGPEFHYVFDQEGRDLLGAGTVEAELRGLWPDTTLVVVIDNRAREVPTVGQLFFAYRFDDSFQNVRIRNRRFISTIVDGRWTHLRKKGGEP